MSAPLLSIVVSGRNDDYGETFAARFQTFLRHLGSLEARHRNLFELIAVEWNPPQDRASLAQAFDWSGIENGRIIVVPPEHHASLGLPAGVPMVEFWAKNVGVRRARAPFVLSTNPDIVFSTAFFDWLAETQLDPQCFYRADRYDFVPDLAFEAEGPDIPQRALEAIYEAHTRNTLREGEPFSHFIDPSAPLESWPQSRPFYRDELSGDGLLIQGGERSDPLAGLHTQASGDFLLASKEAWTRVRGHWERLDMFTHLDSYLVCNLHGAGYRQCILRRPVMVMHMDHSREAQKTRPSRSFAEVLPEFQACAAGTLRNPNGPDWGLGERSLQELAPSGARRFTAGSAVNDQNALRELGRVHALAAARRVAAQRAAALLEDDLRTLRRQMTALQADASATHVEALAVQERERADLRAERDKLREELDAALAERDEARHAMSRATAEREASDAETQRVLGLAAELQSALARQSDELATARAGREEFAAALIEAEAEHARLGAAMAEMTRDRDRLAKDLGLARQTAAHLEAHATQSSADTAALRQALGDAQARIAQLEAQARADLRAWTRDRARLGDEVQRQRAERAKLIDAANDARALSRALAEAKAQAERAQAEVHALAAEAETERLRAEDARAEAQETKRIEREQQQRAANLLQALETELGEREKQFELLRAKLTEANQQQDGWPTEEHGARQALMAERDRLLAALEVVARERDEALVYKTILDRSRYFRLRRIIVGFLRP